MEEEWIEKLDELLEADDANLTDWEIDFIEDLNSRSKASMTFEPTQTQLDKLDQIYRERID